MLDGFFIGWAAPLSPQKHYDVLKNSAFFIAAVDADTDLVVGFITAVSDYVYSAFIPLLEVLPEYQGRGIGSELMERMLSILSDMQSVDLMCDEELQGYYERFGMHKAKGMMQRFYFE